MASHFGSFDGSKLGAFVRSELKARNITPFQGWNFLRLDNLNYYTKTGLLTPFIACPGTTTKIPSGGSNELMLVEGNKIFSQTGVYDIEAGTSTAYSGISLLKYIVKIGGTYYCTCSVGGGGTINVGTSTDGINWTTSVFPTILGRSPTNAVQIWTSGGLLLIAVQYGGGAPQPTYLLTTNDGGATWNSSNRVAANCSLIASWYDSGTMNVLGDSSGVKNVFASTDLFATHSTTTFSHTGAATGNDFKTVVLSGSDALLYYRTNIRVLDLTNTAADITYPSDASGVTYPFVDSDGTMYGYKSGIWSSTDYENFTQLTTETASAALFLNKRSQLL